MHVEKQKLGLYIHIPFCLKKCNYCDFLSFSGCDFKEQTRYIKAVEEELKAYNLKESDYQVDTIFIGGGTPSLLSEDLTEMLLKCVHHYLFIDENAEISIECNPKTLTDNKLNLYHRLGINRLSIGCQSLDDSILKFMGRVHNRNDFFETFQKARSYGFNNINVDLIFGVPGQTSQKFHQDVEEILTLQPEHLSFYSLQIEEGTPFYEKYERGEFNQVSDEEDRRMYHETVEQLDKNGYIHYEISNAAKKGYKCRHNLKYWSMADYLGVGLGAHSYIQGVRFNNTKNMQDYLNGNYVEASHKNTRKDSLSDYLFTGLRKIEGIDLSEFEKKFGQPIESLYGEMIHMFQEKGLLELSKTHLRFTKNGLDLSNTVLRELI